MEIRTNVSLRAMNTFGMEVKAACLAEYSSVEELRSLFPEGNLRSDLPRPWHHIGGGSNLLFTKDFEGTVLHSSICFTEEAEPTEDGKVKVRVGSGVIWDDFVAWTCRRGLWGAENLSLIPGETGAAAVQNIGAYGVEAADIISSVGCFEPATGKELTLDVSECGYGYRRSRFKEEWKGRYIVTSVTFMLSGNYSPRLDYGNVRSAVESVTKGADLTPGVIRDAIISIRNSKLPDPSEVGSAGSFFKNPFVSGDVFRHVADVARKDGLGDVPHFLSPDGSIKIPAAWLLEKCGWKGAVMGNAGVWGKQPLVLVNATGKATPDEILALEAAMVRSVQERFSILLEPEVEHI